MINKIELHKRFWHGQGPSLILIPPSRNALYDLNCYQNRFWDPLAMWESEIRRAKAVMGWPTDGIPAIRPNLGVVTIPAMVGQSFQIPEDSMPWPGKPLTIEEIRVAQNRNLIESVIFRLAADFYKIHRIKGEKQVAAYLPDTQGVFDIAHLLFGDEIFTSVLDTEEGNWVTELMGICLQLYIRATKTLKVELNEESETMIHGHATEQGIYFPHAGARLSEDSAILLPPEMIEQLIIPNVKQASQPFGGAFLHYCGYHPTLFTQLTALPEVKAIDLGNPEKYDTQWLLEQCSKTGTILYSRIVEEPDETWEKYIDRIGKLTARTGARVILRPMVFPESRDECLEMLEHWHYLTS